jgi:chemotaxis signal transduction protein
MNGAKQLTSSVELALERQSIELIIESLETHLKSLKEESENYLDFTLEKDQVEDDISHVNEIVAYLTQK